jgi:hypothetical protein
MRADMCALTRGVRVVLARVLCCDHERGLAFLKEGVSFPRQRGGLGHAAARARVAACS